MRVRSSERNLGGGARGGRSVEECRADRWTRVLTERRDQKWRERRTMLFIALVGVGALIGVIVLVCWWR